MKDKQSQARAPVDVMNLGYVVRDGKLVPLDRAAQDAMSKDVAELAALAVSTTPRSDSTEE